MAFFHHHRIVSGLEKHTAVGSDSSVFNPYCRIVDIPRADIKQLRLSGKIRIRQHTIGLRIPGGVNADQLCIHNGGTAVSGQINAVRGEIGAVADHGHIRTIVNMNAVLCPENKGHV